MPPPVEPAITVVPANEASCADLDAVFGVRGASAARIDFGAAGV